MHDQLKNRLSIILLMYKEQKRDSLKFYIEEPHRLIALQKA